MLYNLGKHIPDEVTYYIQSFLVNSESRIAKAQKIEAKRKLMNEIRIFIKYRSIGALPDWFLNKEITSFHRYKITKITDYNEEALYLFDNGYNICEEAKNKSNKKVRWIIANYNDEITTIYEWQIKYMTYMRFYMAIKIAKGLLKTRVL